MLATNGCLNKYGTLLDIGFLKFNGALCLRFSPVQRLAVQVRFYTEVWLANCTRFSCCARLI